MGFKVLITDYAWPTLEIERRVLAAVGADLVVAQTGEEEELVKLAPEADAILTNRMPVTRNVQSAACSCRVVAQYGIGLENIDLDYATQLGILVTSGPQCCLDEISDLAMGMLLDCARGITRSDRATHQGLSDRAAERPVHRLRGKTLGLVGYGGIAQAIIPKAKSFGLEVIAYSPHIPYGRMTSFGALTNTLNFLLEESDFVSIHLPLNSETHGIINAQALSSMKKTAYLINTASRGIVDEADLVQALQGGRLAGAALDGLSQGHPLRDHPLLAFDNVLITPHAAGYSSESIQEMAQAAAEQVALVLCNRVPSNVANPQVLEQTTFRLEIKLTGAYVSPLHVS